MTPIQHFGQGKAFGELALKFDQKKPTRNLNRQASVYCLTNCKFATLTKKDYQDFLTKEDQKRTDQMIKFF